MRQLRWMRVLSRHHQVVRGGCHRWLVRAVVARRRQLCLQETVRVERLVAVLRGNPMWLGRAVEDRVRR